MDLDGNDFQHDVAFATMKAEVQTELADPLPVVTAGSAEGGVINGYVTAFGYPAARGTSTRPTAAGWPSRSTASGSAA